VQRGRKRREVETPPVSPSHRLLCVRCSKHANVAAPKLTTTRSRRQCAPPQRHRRSRMICSQPLRRSHGNASPLPSWRLPQPQRVPSPPAPVATKGNPEARPSILHYRAFTSSGQGRQSSRPLWRSLLRQAGMRSLCRGGRCAASEAFRAAARPAGVLRAFPAAETNPTHTDHSGQVTSSPVRVTPPWSSSGVVR
jgi:hypothetical protein